MQRFDANGAKVGDVIVKTTGARHDFIAASDHLRVLDWGGVFGEPSGVTITRLTLLGGRPFERSIGVSDQQTHARFARYGTQIIVAWQRAGATQLALAPF